MFSFLASFFNAFFPSLVAARFVNILLAAICILTVFLIGKELKDDFFGLLSAILFAFSSFLLFYSTRAILDISLMAFFCLTLLGIIKYLKNKNLFWIAFPIVLALLSKRAGFAILFFVWFSFLFIDAKNKTRLKNIFLKSVFFIVIILLTFVFFTSKYLIVREVELANNLFFSFFQLIQVLLNFSVFILFLFLLVGAYKILKSKNVAGILILIYFLILFSSFFNSIVIDRFLLPLLPIIILLGLFGLFEFLNFFAPKHCKPIVIGLVLFLCIFGVFQFWAISDAASKGFIEFEGVGKWLKNNLDPQNSIIFNGSRRELRLYSGFEFSEFGGNIFKFPTNQTEFEKILNSHTNNVFVVLDIWAPEYIPPYINDSYLKSKNFIQVEKIYYPDSKKIEIFVIYKK